MKRYSVQYVSIWEKLISYSEALLFFEKSGDKVAICVHLDAVPTGVGDHERRHAFDDGIVVCRHVDAEELMPCCYCVVLVYAFGCSTVPYVVLSARCHVSSENTSIYR